MSSEPGKYEGLYTEKLAPGAKLTRNSNSGGLRAPDEAGIGPAGLHIRPREAGHSGFSSSRLNLSPFTKDFRGEGHK